MYLFDPKMFNKILLFLFMYIWLINFGKRGVIMFMSGPFSDCCYQLSLLNDLPLNADNAHLRVLKNTWYVMLPFWHDKV